MVSTRKVVSRRLVAALVVLTMVIAGIGLIAGPAIGETSFEWEQVNVDSFGVTSPVPSNSVTSMAVYNDRLYAGTFTPLGCQIWRYDGDTTWTQVVGQDPFGTPGTGPGFGDPLNFMAFSMASADRLYVGTLNFDTGCEVWAYNGQSWTRVGNAGLGGGMNYSIVGDMAVLDSKVYAAVSDLPGGTAAPARIFRYEGGTNWTQENNDGFDNPDNEVCRSLEVHDNRLYAGTGNYPEGCEIWRFDGPTKHDWTRIANKGFGNIENVEARCLASYNGDLYAGINGDSGVLYRYDGGTSWTRLFSAEGDSLRVMEDYHGGLFLGFSDNSSLLEIWKYDGTHFWKVSENGFGDVANIAVHSMEIYDNHLYCGVANPNTGCEVWRNKFPATATWYLAEGTSAWGFDTFINIENPNPSEATARVTYMSTGDPAGNGVIKSRDVTLPPESQTSILANDDIGFEVDFSTEVICLEGKTIAVDRTMVWQSADAQAGGYHNSIGANFPARTWYLPEGSSAWGFDCWTLVQNPNPSEANITLTYMIEESGPVSFEKTIPANSRATYSMAQDIGSYDASIKIRSDMPVVPERAMYKWWTPPDTNTEYRREGHVSIGTTTPSTSYYLAEGTTAWGFTTYVLVQNPNNEDATVTLTYMTPDGPVVQDPFTMVANSRKTVKVNDQLPDTDLSTTVRSDKPIVAERAMYWSTEPDTGEAMHDSIGTGARHSVWYLPDGRTTTDDDGIETYTLVANPNNTEVEIRVSYLTEAGVGNVTFTDTIPANSRRTYDMADFLSETAASIRVESLTEGKKIICERSMYYQGRWGGSETIGGYSD